MAVKSPGVLTMSGRPTARNGLAPSVPAVSSLARDRRSGMVAPAGRCGGISRLGIGAVVAGVVTTLGGDAAQ